MAAFEDTGQPTGYDQIQPGTDLPKMKPAGPMQRPLGQPAPPPLMNAITQPAQYPGDPAMMRWRQGSVGNANPFQPGQANTGTPQGGLGQLFPGGPQSSEGAGGLSGQGSMPLSPQPGGAYLPNGGSALPQLTPQAPPLSANAPATATGQLAQPTPPAPKPTTPAATNPTASAPTAKPAGGNLQDPSYAGQMVAWAAAQPGADPSLKSDPGYWTQKINSGTFGTDESYIYNKMATAWKSGAPKSGVSPIQQATLFSGQQNGQQSNMLQGLILQLLQQSASGNAPTTPAYGAQAPLPQ